MGAFDNTDNNTNPGFTTGNSDDGMQGGIAINKDGLPHDGINDLGKILVNLINAGNSPNQNGNSQGGIAISPSQQILQDVAQKSYTKQLQEHADQTPHQILGNLIDQWGQQGGGTVPEVNQGLNGQPQEQPQQKAQEPQSIDDQIAQINKQSALNVAKSNLSASKPQGFLQRFGNNLTKMEGGVTQQERLQDLGTIQKIAGGEPLQPKDVQELNVGSYKAALDASHNAAAVEQQKLTSLTDLYGKLNETKGVVARTLGNASKEQDKVLSVAQNSADNLSTHLGNLRTLIAHRPTFSSKGQNSQAQDTTNKINQGKVGKYTLVSK